MAAITFHPSTRASSPHQHARVLLNPNVNTFIRTSPIFFLLDGPLPEGRWLTHPIMIKLEEDDGEFVVSEPRYFMHASGSTVQEAIQAFKRIFSGYLDILSEEEENLSEYMHEQLQYLRSTIRIV